MKAYSHIAWMELAVGYGGKKVLVLPEMNLVAGKIYCVFGRNGSGKTTLLKTIAGLIPAISGSVIIDAKPWQEVSLSERAQFMSLVLTKTPFNASMTVHDFVSFGRYPYTNWMGKLKAEDEQVIDQSLKLCGLSHMQNRLLAEISDGEMQKTQIARALAQETPVLLLDEPVAHLDLVNKAEIFQILKKVVWDQGRTILFSSHDVSFALQLADAFLVIQEGKGSYYDREMFGKEKIYEAILSSPHLNIDGDAGNVRFIDPS